MRKIVIKIGFTTSGLHLNETWKSRIVHQYDLQCGKAEYMRNQKWFKSYDFKKWINCHYISIALLTCAFVSISVEPMCAKKL